MNDNNFPQKFFLYCRKSTDVEDKQVLSIEAQITELRAFAKQNNLDIIEELVEKQSAKKSGEENILGLRQSVILMMSEIKLSLLIEKGQKS